MSVCEGCNVPIVQKGRGRPRKWCSRECKDRAKTLSPEERARRAEERKRLRAIQLKDRERACPICGADFLPTAGGRTCSLSCGQRLRYELAPNENSRKSRTCEICGVTYKASYIGQRTCGRACGEMLRRTVTGTMPSERREKPWPTCRVYFPTCIMCGKVFTAPHRDTRVCGAECKAARKREYMNANYERFKPTLLRAAHDRRARMLSVKRESINPIKVYERDGWRCQLCHQPVRRKARRKRDPLMASLDHIIPIGQGGTHTYDNVQCAHYRCNLSKNDKAGPKGDQLLLFG